MAEDDEDRVKPTEQRGGTTPGEAEARAKGDWAGKVGDGIVPAELGGSDAPDSALDKDPDYSDAALGRTTGSDEPATEAGIDPAAGDAADATTHGGAKRPADAEPDLKDATGGPRAVDADSAA
jgi:hypothetical protein